MSRTLGLCPTGVKREPKVKRYSYHYVNVGSATVGLIGRGRILIKTGLAAVEETVAWQSGRSSPRQIRSGTWQRAAVIARGNALRSRED